MKDERDKLVKKALEKGPQRFSEIKKNTGLHDASLDRALKSMKKYGEITEDEKWYALPKHWDKLQEKIRYSYRMRVGAQLLYTLRKEHTVELKEVLVLWRNALRNESRIQVWPEWEMPNSIVYRDFMNHRMFDHLRYHIPRLMKKWDDFQNNLWKQAEIGWDLIPVIGEKIAEDLGMKFIYYGEGKDKGVLIHFPELILRVLSHLAEGSVYSEEGGESFFRDACDGKGKIAPLQDGYGYIIMTKKPISKEILVITLPKGSNTDEKRSEIDNYRKRLLNDLRNSKCVMSKMKEHHELRDDLLERWEKIIKEIDKHCSYLVLPGICEIVKKAI